MPRTSIHRALLIGVVLGIALRILLALFTRGTNDILAWEEFASVSASTGLHAVYLKFNGVEGRLLMNNPPLAGLVGAGCWWMAKSLEMPFWTVFKMLQVLGEVCTIWLLGQIAWHQTGSRQTEWRAKAVYALSPVAILISGYHGNTDAVCVLGVVAAALAVQYRRYFWAGCALAFAINIKVIPIVCIPFFLLTARSFKDAGWLILGGVLGIIPMSLFLLGNQQAFLNIFGYASNVEPWGIRAVAVAMVPAMGEASIRLVAVAGLVGLFCSSLWRVIRASSFLSHPEALMIPLAAFMFFAPGFGVQYCIYPLAGLVLCAPRQALVWSSITGAFLLSVYLKWIVTWWPVTSMHAGTFAFYDSVLLGLLSWGGLGVMLFKSMQRVETTASQAGGVNGQR